MPNKLGIQINTASYIVLSRDENFCCPLPADGQRNANDFWRWFFIPGPLG